MINFLPHNHSLAKHNLELKLELDLKLELKLELIKVSFN